MRDATDRELVAASLGGDVRAFGALVERHHGAAVAVAFAITRDLALSEDIAQDAFVVAWTRLAELKDPGSVRAWLCNIARNQSKNELRRRGEALSTLFGGKDLTQPMQFHDVAPGTYTLCVDRRIDREHPLPLLCQPVEVAGELVEIAVAPPR